MRQFLHPRGGLLGTVTFLLMLAALYAIFIYAPVEKTMGVVQKIFYLHVSAAFLAFLGFFITFVSSVLFLARGQARWDRLAHCAAETGMLFCTMVLITGPLWAKPVWNVWWTWDPRLTTTLILWFVYYAYLMLRGMSDSNNGARRGAAVFGIIGFVNVPITFMAIRQWRTIHPVVFSARGIGISDPMKLTLGIALLAFSLLFLSLLASRMRVARAQARLDGIRFQLAENPPAATHDAEIRS